jgi:hypothetical protein
MANDEQTTMSDQVRVKQAVGILEVFTTQS